MFTLNEVIPQHVIYLHIYGTTTIEELEDITTALIAYLDDVDQQVHVIIDMRDLTEFPKNVRNIAKTTVAFGHSNYGWSVLLSDNRALRFISSAVIQIVSQRFASTRFRAFEDWAHAMAFLQSVDLTLPELPAELVPAV